MHINSQRGIQTCHAIYLSVLDMILRAIVLDIVATPSRRGEIDIPCSELSATDDLGTSVDRCAGFTDPIELLLTFTK